MPRDEIAEEARLWLGRPRERVLKEIKLAREVAGYAGIDLATGRIRADIEYYRSRAVLAERVLKDFRRLNVPPPSQLYAMAALRKIGGLDRRCVRQ
jgi:hypothetical protein